MRPNEAKNDEELYECIDCSRHFEAPRARTCPDCGGRLVNIGKSRDL